MKRFSLTAVCLTLAFLTLASVVSAQVPATRGDRRPGPRPNQRPVTSPYLNLIGGRPSGNFAFEYYRRVRPEMEFRRNDTQFSQSLQTLQVEVDQQRATTEESIVPNIGPTGHQTYFMNYGRYYNAQTSQR